MTTRPLLTLVFVFAAGALCLPTSGCISLNIGPKGPEKSAGAVAKPPPSTYTELKGVRADGAWRNSKSGNTISYLSTCNDPADPSLDMATDEVLSGLGPTKNLVQKKIEFEGREALDSEAEARVEGIPTKIHALLFKKNGCLYTLSLVGLAKSFEAGQADFENFVKGFTAP